MTDAGWQVEPRPVAEGLVEGFEAERYTEPEPLHIRDWASFAELIGPDGLKALAKAVV